MLLLGAALSTLQVDNHIASITITCEDLARADVSLGNLWPRLRSARAAHT